MPTFLFFHDQKQRRNAHVTSHQSHIVLRPHPLCVHSRHAHICESINGSDSCISWHASLYVLLLFVSNVSCACVRDRCHVQQKAFSRNTFGDFTFHWFNTTKIYETAPGMHGSHSGRWSMTSFWVARHIACASKFSQLIFIKYTSCS